MRLIVCCVSVGTLVVRLNGTPSKLLGVLAFMDNFVIVQCDSLEPLSKSTKPSM